MNKGKIIFLNGVSSSGKSTLAKNLVNKLPDYFHFSVDDYDLIIDKMENRDQNHLIPVPTEYFYHRSIKMFSDKGINLILDHILHDEFTSNDFIETLKDYPVIFIGVHCPKEELMRREQARGDRRIGQAVSQLEYVHQQNEVYDLNIDTYTASLDDCIEQIAELIGRDGNGGWKSTVNHFFTNEKFLGV